MQYQNTLTSNDQWIVEHVFPRQHELFFVEAGACDGIGASSCYVLEKYLGWQGICIEPNHDYFQQLVLNRPGSICENKCLARHSGQVTYLQGEPNLINPMLGGIKDNLIRYKHDHQAILAKGRAIAKAAISLEELLIKHQAPHTIHYLAMDIEGSELPVLEEFPFAKYKILAISIEGIACNDLLVAQGYFNVQNPFNYQERYEQFFLHPSIFDPQHHCLTSNHFLSLGNCFAREQSTDQAIAAYQQAIQQEPNNIQNYLHLGSYLRQQEDWQGAIINFNQAININPQQPDWVYYTLGGIHKKLQQWPEALAAYQQAIAIEPQQPAWLFSSLGHVHQELGQLEAAARAYRKAIAIEPQQPSWVLSSLGNVLRELGQVAQALVLYQQAIELEPQQATWINPIIDRLRREP